MGSDNSKEDLDEEKKNQEEGEIKINRNGSSYFNTYGDTVSSYKGVKSGTSDSESAFENAETEPSPKTESQKEQNEEETENNNLAEVTFVWNEGGESALVTGSFCGWTQFFIMEKKNDGSFFYKLNLPKGFHQYKFKIDGQWRFSNNFPTHNDNGNINNCIDTTNFVAEKKKNKYKEDHIKNNNEKYKDFDSSTNSGDSNSKKKEKEKHTRYEGIDVKKYYKEEDNDIKDKNIKSKEKHHERNKQNSENKLLNLKNVLYGNYYPERKEMNTDATEVPKPYIKKYNIDNYTHQETIGDKKFLDLEEKNILSENNSTKTINMLPHIYLNHMHSKVVKMPNYNMFVVTCTQRIKSKISTAVYYGCPNDFK